MRVTDRELREREERRVAIRNGECPDCGGKTVPTTHHSSGTELPTKYEWFRCKGCGTLFGTSNVR